ncbi:PA domain-containing protein [Rhizobiales bacterium GAS188]|nr:PA domain-containing protein [Rhizobiales bacterium GAS188]
MSELASEIGAAVSGQELMRHCAEFAKRVKLSGTPEELESFRYLKACLDAYGYRTELISHDAYISLPGASRVEADGRVLESITHSFSRPSPTGGLTGVLVDLGEGIQADFASADCRGKIVLVDGIASPAVAARAKAAGAAGQLHVSPHEHLHEMCISPVWGNPSDETLAELPSTVACTISQADGQALRAKLRAGAALSVTLHAQVDTGWRKTPLLVGELDAGGGEEAPFVLFSGHHDTWYFGVMDNGSANATMLEAARLLASRRGEWQRGLRICFWSGHSHGRYSGSAWYVDENFEELDRRCVAHVNVDSTGGIGATVLTENGVVAELVGLARTVTLAETGQRHEGKRPSRSSDQSFWGVGIPSMYGSISHQPPSPVKMRNPLGWWWHTPHDLLDKVDEQFLARDTRVVVASLWRLLTDKVLPLDHAAHAAALLGELNGLAPRLRAALGIDNLVASTESLRVKAEALAARDPGDDAARLTRINAALMQVSRALMPLDYTEGDRFSHDPALPQPAWPALQKLRDLAEAEPGSDAQLLLRVGARRARNRLLCALRRATKALDAALAA